MRIAPVAPSTVETSSFSRDSIDKIVAFQNDVTAREGIIGDIRDTIEHSASLANAK
jgi:hypothetical protein